MPKGYRGRVLVHGAVGYTGHQCRCTICVTEWRAYKRAYYHKNKHRSRKYELRVKYGITPEEYDRRFKVQKGKCAICKRRKLLKKRLDIDHDHKTGLVRGLLCRRCNGALGWFEMRQAEILGYLREAYGEEWSPG